MICSKCGKENPEGSQFCSGCGNSLVSTQSNQPSPLVITPATQQPVQQAAPVMQQPVQQPVQQHQQPQYNSNNNSGGFTKNQKIIILALLGVIVVILSVVVIGTLGGNERKKDDTRTIMIYLDGSNLETDNGIASADLLALDPDKIDLEKTHILVYTGGAEKWHNDFVKNDENAIFLFTEDGYEKLEVYDQVSMGDPDTLSGFLNYAYDNYKAGHYNLILDDHGGAIDGAIYDDFHNGDQLSLDDFEEALSDSPFKGKNKLDAVLFRTCLNGTLEVASIFEPYSEYVIFSEEVSVGGGSTDVLSFIHNVDGNDDGLEFGKRFIERYQEQVDDLDLLGSIEVTYSIVDLSKINKVIDELDDFASGIDISKYYNSISKARSKLYQYGKPQNAYDTVDLYALIEKIEDYSSESAEGILDAIEDAVVYNHTNLKESHGISIYFPYNGSMSAKSKFLGVYKKLSFSDNYKRFISKFSSAQSGAKKFTYTLDKNETQVSDAKEISLKLTDEEVESFARGGYRVFKKDKEHPNYYFLVYNSDDAVLTEDGYLQTQIGNNLIKVKDPEDGTKYNLALLHRDEDGRDSFGIITTMYSNKKEYGEKGYSYGNVRTYFGFEEDKPVISYSKVASDYDERVIGMVLDPDEYDYIETYFYEYKLFDKNGKQLEEFEASPTYVGIGGKIKELEFERAKLDDDEEYYVVFDMLDVNNDVHSSNLIKVG